MLEFDAYRISNSYPRLSFSACLNCLPCEAAAHTASSGSRQFHCSAGRCAFPSAPESTLPGTLLVAVWGRIASLHSSRSHRSPTLLGTPRSERIGALNYENLMRSFTNSKKYLCGNMHRSSKFQSDLFSFQISFLCFSVRFSDLGLSHRDYDAV